MAGMTSVGKQTVAQAGEDAVLASLLEVIDPHRLKGQDERLRVGPGEDDAAVFSLPRGAQCVMSNDTMSHGQDFRLGWWAEPEEAARDIGIKAAAQNLSDLNAMGAAPELLLVSLTLPPATTVSWVQEFYRGLLEACDRPGAQGCVIAGGDLSSGEQLSVSITALGQLAGNSAGLLRSGAQVGDTLAVSGRLGLASAGLALLERFGTAQEVLRQTEGEAGRIAVRCLQAQMRPDPPLAAGPAALTARATAGMDLSDGLLRDAGRLASASGVTLALDDSVLASEVEALLPVAGELGEAPETAAGWVYAGGEEYALLATFPPETLPEGFRRIGAVGEPSSAGPEVLTEHATGRTGWNSL